MATTNKDLAYGTLGTALSTLYTAPGTYTIVKSVSLCNQSASILAVTFSLRTINILCANSIAANDAIHISPLDHVLGSAQTITGSAAAASVTYYISGIEVT